MQLWRKMLSMLFETGHPWITFKDACNVRSPQQHVGVVHSSNLCTEITLNTGDNEIAVCNLGSVNLLAHMKPSAGGCELDHEKLQRTIRTAMRMLDNVIDINYYAVPKARNSNLRHRPVGLGIMGFQDACTDAAPTVRLRRRDGLRRPLDGGGLLSTRTRPRPSSPPSAAAILVPPAACGTGASCRRTRWSSCGRARRLSSTSTTSGDARLGVAARAHHASTACATRTAWRSRPTATISNIIGVAASIEPEYQNIYVKSNLSGEFTVVNEQLVARPEGARICGTR